MKTIKLKKLTIKDWRGQNKDVEFSGINEVRGRNESGKSTLFNAFLWLLTGVDEADRANYELYDNTIVQTKENSKVGIVEAVMDIDGVEYTLKKTYEMGWVRERGATEYKRKGTDNYHFYIDEIERPAKSYKQFVEETFAPIDKLKIMLNIRHFFGLDWKTQRKNLESFVGKFDPSSLNGDYSDIMDDLQRYGVDDLKTHYRALLKKVKEDSSKLPSAIETLQNVLAQYDIDEINDAENKIAKAREDIDAIDKQINGSSEHLKPIIEQRNKEIAEIEALKADFRKCKSDYQMLHFDNENKLKDEIAAVDRYNESIEKEYADAVKAVETAKTRLAGEKKKLISLTDYRETLRKQNANLKTMEFTDDKCPMCGQTLPDDKLEEARTSFFNKRDAKRKVVVAEGKRISDNITECEKLIEELQIKATADVEKKPFKSKEKLVSELSHLRTSFVPYEESINGKEKARQIEEKEANLTQIPQVDNEALINTKKELMNDIVEYSELKGKKADYESYTRQIAEKEQELKDNACEQARIEGLLATLDKYIRERADFLSDEINRNFKVVNVQTYDFDKSGNMVDTCRITINGVSVNVTNNASRLLAGIDISTAFGRLYGVNMPLFVDNCEGIDEDKFPEIPNQVIKNIRCNENFNIISK